jgi:hypothetical protein
MVNYRPGRSAELHVATISTMAWVALLFVSETMRYTET